METRDLKPGDVVQISPTSKTRMPGCLAQVERVEAWGVTAWVGLPGVCDGVVCMVGVVGEPWPAPLVRAYIRLGWGDMEYVGRAAWTDESDASP